MNITNIETAKKIVKKIEVQNNTEIQEDPDYEVNAMREAVTIWDELKKYIKQNPKFKLSTEEEKIEWIQRSHSQFQNEFPIVCRYMISLGRFEEEAFKMFLSKKKKMKKTSHAEDHWCQLRAFYAKYLWAVCYSKSHRKSVLQCLVMKEAKIIWEDAYKKLTEEFEGFRDLYKKAETKLEKEAAVNKKERIAELNEGLRTGKAKIDNNMLSGYVNILKAQLIVQRRKFMIDQISFLSTRSTSRYANEKIVPNFIEPTAVSKKVPLLKKKKVTVKKQAEPNYDDVYPEPVDEKAQASAVERNRLEDLEKKKLADAKQSRENALLSTAQARIDAQIGRTTK
jgi:hypothetical protein